MPLGICCLGKLLTVGHDFSIWIEGRRACTDPSVPKSTARTSRWSPSGTWPVHCTELHGRSSTGRSWTFFHEARFYLLPADPRSRRRLYPVEFVDRLEQIAKDGYVGKRLEFDHWKTFSRDALAAYQESIAPLLRRVEEEKGTDTKRG